MTHWHLITANGARDILGVARYEQPGPAIVDYLDIVYDVFNDVVEESDRMTYLDNMLSISENFIGYHIYTRSKKLSVSWTDCDDDPCTFAIYN